MENTWQVLLDIDGVLADFTRAVYRWFGLEYEEHPEPGVYHYTEKRIQELTGTPAGMFWKVIDNYEFWRNIPKYPWTHALIRQVTALVGKENVWLISSVPFPTASAGRQMWIQEQLHETFWMFRTLLGSPKFLCARKGHVLIDDSDVNCDNFSAWGGKTVLFPAMWNRRLISQFDATKHDQILEIVRRELRGIVQDNIES